jgi:hypothetical protein
VSQDSRFEARVDEFLDGMPDRSLAEKDEVIAHSHFKRPFGRLGILAARINAGLIAA